MGRAIDVAISYAGKTHSEYVNTWPIDGFVPEGSQPAEMTGASHDADEPWSFMNFQVV